MAAKLRPRVMLPRLASTSDARAAEARGRQLQRLVGQHCDLPHLAQDRFTTATSRGEVCAARLTAGVHDHVLLGDETPRPRLPRDQKQYFAPACTRQQDLVRVGACKLRRTELGRDRAGEAE